MRILLFLLLCVMCSGCSSVTVIRHYGVPDRVKVRRVGLVPLRIEKEARAGYKY